MKIQRIPWKNIGIFLMISYSLFWIPFFLMKLLEWRGNDSSIWTSIFGILGPYSPLIAAIIMLKIITKEGFRNAHLGIKRVHWVYWLFAILLPFFWNGIQDVLQLLFGFT